MTGPVILLYHRIADPSEDPYGLCVPPTEFAEHLSLIQSKGLATPLAEIADTGSSRGIAITFDDGYLDNLTVASPMLIRHEVPATFFVTTEALEPPHTFWWDQLSLDAETHASVVAASAEERDSLVSSLRPARGRSAGADARAISRDELRQLAGRPGHTIGAHTARHLCLPRQTPAVIERELAVGKCELERVLQTPVTWVAYPFGACDQITTFAAGRTGFAFGVTATPGPVLPTSNRLSLPRVEVRRGTDLLALLSEHCQ